MQAYLHNWAASGILSRFGGQGHAFYTTADVTEGPCEGPSTEADKAIADAAARRGAAGRGGVDYGSGSDDDEDGEARCHSPPPSCCLITTSSTPLAPDFVSVELVVLALTHCKLFN
jgi:hypothetical protein